MKTENTKLVSFSKIICHEIIHLFKASQFGLVYLLNIMLISLWLGVLISLILGNSGDFFINIFNFFVKRLSIPDGNYQGSYLFITFIIYIAEKWWYKKFGTYFIIQTKYKIIAIPVIVCLGYISIIYFFSLKYGFWSIETLILGIFAMVTIIANYYYLLISYSVKYLDKKII